MPNFVFQFSEIILHSGFNTIETLVIDGSTEHSLGYIGLTQQF